MRQESPCCRQRPKCDILKQLIVFGVQQEHTNVRTVFNIWPVQTKEIIRKMIHIIIVKGF